MEDDDDDCDAGCPRPPDEEEEEEEEGDEAALAPMTGVGRGGMLLPAVAVDAPAPSLLPARLADDLPYSGMMSPLRWMSALQTGQSPWPACIHWWRHDQQYR
jgi:hypothetical protein